MSEHLDKDLVYQPPKVFWSTRDVFLGSKDSLDIFESILTNGRVECAPTNSTNPTNSDVELFYIIIILPRVHASSNILFKYSIQIFYAQCAGFLLVIHASNNLHSTAVLNLGSWPLSL